MRRDFNNPPFRAFFVAYQIMYYNADGKCRGIIDRNITVDILEGNEIEIIGATDYHIWDSIDEFTLTPLLCKVDADMKVYMGVSQIIDLEDLKDWRIERATKINSPQYQNMPIVFECKKVGRDGLAIKAKLVNVNVDNAIVDEDGDICMSKAFGMHGFAIIED